MGSPRLPAMIRLPLSDLHAGERALDPPAARYLTRVHRLGRGALIVAFDPAARVEADAEIIAAGAVVRVVLAEPRPATRLPARQVAVVQAAGKANKIDGVLRDATELGATRFVVAVADRSVKRPPAEQIDRWRRIALEAARQSGRGDLPEIAGPMALPEALCFAAAPVAILLDPLGGPMAALRCGRDRAVAVAIGPEGGWSAAEIACAQGAGYRRAAIGPFVLRTETACAAALGIIATWPDKVID